ncbi:MAG: sulfatase [Rikenellaceae bacterium]
MKLEKNLILSTSLLAGAMVAAGGASAFAQSQKQSPNLLYIFPDQYRVHAMGIWSNPEYRELMATVADPVHTPNIDKLAQQGALFTHACSMFPVSSPHRGMLMSGMYSQQNGLDMNAHKSNPSGLNHDLKTFTNVLDEAGYETAYVGKVHWERTQALFDANGNYVGTLEEPGGHLMNDYDTYVPEGAGRFGNDFWYQQVIDNHFNTVSYSNQPQYVGGKTDGEQHKNSGQFATMNESEVVLDYINNKGGNMRDESKPFSMIWSINPPHSPYSRLTDCETEEYARFADMSVEELLVRDNVIFKDDADKARLELTAKIYFALISGVDREIGRVLEALENQGLAENTIVVFTSDHGDMMGSHGKMGKPQIYDEAFMVPYIIRYPGVIEPKITDLQFNTIDIMPTLLSMMGFKDQTPDTVDGRDYSAGIINDDYSVVPKPKSALYRAFKDRGLRTYDYAYVVHPTGEYAIYDLRVDPYQMNALTFEQIPAEDGQMLKDELGFWLKDCKDSWYRRKTNKHLINY